MTKEEEVKNLKDVELEGASGGIYVFSKNHKPDEDSDKPQDSGMIKDSDKGAPPSKIWIDVI